MHSPPPTTHTPFNCSPLSLGFWDHLFATPAWESEERTYMQDDRPDGVEEMRGTEILLRTCSRFARKQHLFYLSSVCCSRRNRLDCSQCESERLSVMSDVRETLQRQADQKTVVKGLGAAKELYEAVRGEGERMSSGRVICKKHMGAYFLDPSAPGTRAGTPPIPHPASSAAQLRRFFCPRKFLRLTPGDRDAAAAPPSHVLSPYTTGGGGSPSTSSSPRSSHSPATSGGGSSASSDGSALLGPPAVGASPPQGGAPSAARVGDGASGVGLAGGGASQGPDAFLLRVPAETPSHARHRGRV